MHMYFSNARLPRATRRLSFTAMLLSVMVLPIAAMAQSSDKDSAITNSMSQALSLVPLIESASVRLSANKDIEQIALYYKPTTEHAWTPAFDMVWEPVAGKWQGVLLHLRAGTEYEVKVQARDQGKGQEWIQRFTTRSQFPAVDPQKVIALRDIYQGGQLNLKALKVNGSPGAWAMIQGDPNTVIKADELESAVFLQGNAYVVLKDIVIDGGWRYGVQMRNSHHIWITGCDISKWGRVPTVFKKGRGYATPESKTPINYDAGIDIDKSGVVTVEDCHIHSPNYGANSWTHGHPKGANAIQVWAQHKNEQFQGQVIIRHNRIQGSDQHRFNDAIEGRKNTELLGGFVRDSAIHNNQIAYANDDLIEIDGGQSGVLVYNNQLSQGYVGISALPNRRGPSYLFNNAITSLGDQDGNEWTAIKLGGLRSAPQGQVFVLQNWINVDRNGIAASSVKGDNTFWADVRNNVIITQRSSNLVGLGIYDPKQYPDNRFVHNLIYNRTRQAPYAEAKLAENSRWIVSPQTLSSVLGSQRDPYVDVALAPEHILHGFHVSAPAGKDQTTPPFLLRVGVY
ncbi:right-handed parallel beta-helix repeat-containing protein [Alteromonas oceanisediminis]|uniref:right-handed parallel beta-helix repeat-containing protein n=1 Tax=Alteromonas oceanisediminis TaxID=2836180 RepID=UPI001BDB3725|nr:right-handed parallel beta-helix repeat-containing protein [Alteromonas oceanisediminis]MBT0587608.1 right-handed parallel beta-helix repeat-containing protein [Alteromonas oceanisediminis]